MYRVMRRSIVVVMVAILVAGCGSERGPNASAPEVGIAPNCDAMLKAEWPSTVITH